MTAKLLQELSARDKAAIPEVVASLRKVHQGQSPNPLAPLLDAALGAAGRSETPLFGAVRAGVEAMEKRARRHAEFVDQLTGATAPAPAPSSYQETVYLQGRCGGRTGGRLRCLNRRSRRVEVAARLTPFLQEGEPPAEAPRLAVRPGAFSLAAGEARVIALDVDLGLCRLPGRFEAAVDLLMNDALALKVWIEIDVYD